MKDKIIEAKNIRKKFGNSLALVDISFSIEEGQIFGFLGPSGSGKTTTINILTGQLVADDGDVEILDQSVCHAAGFCRNISGGETAVVQCRDGSAVVVFGHIDDCCAG